MMAEPPGEAWVWSPERSTCKAILEVALLQMDNFRRWTYNVSGEEKVGRNPWASLPGVLERRQQVHELAAATATVTISAGAPPQAPDKTVSVLAVIQSDNSKGIS